MVTILDGSKSLRCLLSSGFVLARSLSEHVVVTIFVVEELGGFAEIKGPWLGHDTERRMPDPSSLSRRCPHAVDVLPLRTCRSRKTSS